MMPNGELIRTTSKMLKFEYLVYSPLPRTEILKLISENTVDLFSLKSGRFRGYIRGSDIAVMRNKSRNLGIELQGNIRENKAGSIINIKIRIGMLMPIYAFSLVASSVTWIALGYREHAPFFFYCMPAFVSLLNFAFGIQEKMLLFSEFSKLIDGEILT